MFGFIKIGRESANDHPEKHQQNIPLLIVQNTITSGIVSSILNRPFFDPIIMISLPAIEFLGGYGYGLMENKDIMDSIENRENQTKKNVGTIAHVKEHLLVTNNHKNKRIHPDRGFIKGNHGVISAGFNEVRGIRGSNTIIYPQPLHDTF